MNVFRLHLNGGPRDDQYLDHWTSDGEVGAVYGAADTIIEAMSERPALRTGHYVLRRDGNGDLVPHNFEGFVEADWQGWRVI